MAQDLKTAGTHAERRAAAPRKKTPIALARVEASRCSGCEVCIAWCPVDCILLLPDPEAECARICRVVEEECIGCKICVNECPWEAIEMVANPAAPPRSRPLEVA